MRDCIQARSNQRLQRGVLGVLGLVMLGVFAAVTGHEFVQWDDATIIYKNPHLTGLGWEELRWMFTDASYTRRYMPLGWLSYAVDRHFFGFNPHVYHTGNLVIHVINGVLLFFLLKRLVLLGRNVGGPEEERVAIWCAGAGALFWAVNPLRVEVVAWASSRIYGAMFLWSMLWLLAWLKAQDPETSAKQRPAWYWGSVAAFGASLLTYPLALFAPVALFVLEVYPLGRMRWGIRTWFEPRSWPVWRDKIPFLLVSLAVTAVTALALVATEDKFKPVSLSEFPVESRLMQAFYVWGYYLWKPWAPYDLAISYMTLHTVDPLARPLVMGLAVVGLATVVLFRARRRWPAGWALWICHTVWLVPVLGLTEYPHSVYDRYGHLQGVLWAVAAAAVLRVCWVREQRGWLAVGTLGVVSAMFGMLAWQQVWVWRSTIPLYEHLLARVGDHPDRSRFDYVLAVHYQRAGLTNEAAASLERAVHYETRRTSKMLFNEGVLKHAHLRLGDIESAQTRLHKALDHYQASVREDPRFLPALLKTASTLDTLNRDEEATGILQQALAVAPGDPAVHEALGTNLERRGRLEEAQRHRDEARRLRGQ